MKRIWQHPEVKSERRYWRSLGEYHDTPEFKERLGREFDPSINFISEDERESSRRQFMKIMGGAAALAGLTLTSCRRPLQKILPFTDHVEWIIPGKPLLYATAMPRSGGATPMVVVTHEGRPTHLQGNPLHPSGGGLDVFAQASVLELYNPDRVKEVQAKGKVSSWKAFDKKLRAWDHMIWEKDGGEGVAILMSPNTSPTRSALLKEVAARLPKAKVYAYEPLHRGQQAAALKALVGPGVTVVPRLAKAERVFALDSDFLGLDADSELLVKDFMSMRAPVDPAKDKMNRLYVVENRYTLTGGMSDHRKPLAASLIPVAAAILAEEVGKLAGDAALQQAAAGLAGSVDIGLREWLATAAKDLVANRGKSLVFAGPRQSEAVQGLVLALNQTLGALGTTLELLQTGADEYAGADELLAEIKAKKIGYLFVTAESDPAYDLPGFEAAVREAKPRIVQLALRPNRTGHFAQWTLPATTYLESWGDVRQIDGTYSIVQPMISPLFGGISENDLLLALAGRKRLSPEPPAEESAEGAPAPLAPPQADPAYEAVKASFAALAGGWNEESWNHVLRDGFLKNSAYAIAGAMFNVGALAGLVAKAPMPSAAKPGGVEVVLAPSANMWDGRYIDNPWLHEAPDPITKLTWDNAAWISPRTFASLGLKKDGDTVTVTVGDKTLTLPAFQCPGHAHDSVTIPLGYGQKNVGSVIGEQRGFNGYLLRSGVNEFVLTGAQLTNAGGHYELANAQENYTMEGRALVREGTLDKFEGDPDFAQTQGMDSHIPPNISLYKGRMGRKSEENPEGFDYENEHQWGMVIDLSKCLGCSACAVACQSENNIPVVGKDQVRKGRIMHWIRMDRYFATSDGVRSEPDMSELDNPSMVSQPVACQQCESAPCETVCPVNATVHTEDGLNAMAYNRCIGTRYCANNCPYTARRFNFFDWNKRNPFTETKVVGITTGNLYAGPLGEKKPQEVIQLQKNPNVTVRMRGVIEKCTYCVQRLEEAKIRQRAKARDNPDELRVKDGMIKVACQASCSADAVIFGDLANPDAKIVEAKNSPRNYDLLKYIGTRPRTSYLARIRNVNQEMLPFEKDRIVPTGGSTSMKNSF
ncbi:4Fe-4S dicluster domain-containing protein [Phragmitibacter flavus]|uniref:4Fe-4S dicluster domain-containing protein n=1 Tax=Phragmitibacter flavus TaxID=2576071 RepID=A0A5R8KD44_9BACT|nr:TAT-variant-translocated molybdopterin oxidoreductase [Phragmitibacter flavus]TLD70232.1 4Fe-4S dicluster domain-containing protein [Phragmitibacter flavus]